MKTSIAIASARLSQCWPLKVTGAPWKTRILYLAESLPQAITEPLKVIAPIAAPRISSSRLPLGIGSIAPPAAGRATMPKAYGSTAAATAMNTAAMPIMLWKNATSSGICVISTVLARQAP